MREEEGGQREIMEQTKKHRAYKNPAMKATKMGTPRPTDRPMISFLLTPSILSLSPVPFVLTVLVGGGGGTKETGLPDDLINALAFVPKGTVVRTVADIDAG
jgi:hypothetical protein